jgi:hypothetical protein
MRKFLALVKGITVGDIAVERIEKTYISRTPGDVTEVAHN